MSKLNRANRLRIILIVLALATLPAISGCVSYGHGGYYAAPPPAYANHGAVHHYDDIVLVFDVAWNGWAVRGHPNHYFFDNHYYRWHGGRWDRSRHFRRGWRRVNIGSVPPRLHRHRPHRRHRHSADDRRDGHREATHQRPEEHRRAAREGPRDRRPATRERREEPRDVAQGPREERWEGRRDNRDDREVRHEPPRERPEARRETVRDRREVRRAAAPKPRDARDGKSETVLARRESRRQAASQQRPERGKPVRKGVEERDRARGKKTGDSKKAKAADEESAEVEVAARHARRRLRGGGAR